MKLAALFQPSAAGSTPAMRLGARGPLVWAGLAAIAVIALLLAFDQVVRQSVEQGAQRRAGQAERANAAWRCKAAQARDARADCRVAVR